MHKHTFIILALAICMLSCSHSGQDDPFIPGSSESTIAFGGNSGNWQEAGSRAGSRIGSQIGAQIGSRAGEGETGLETLFTSFRVWGYKTKTDTHQDGGNGTAAIQKVMEGYLVDWDPNNKGWEYIGKTNPFLNITQTIKYWDYSASSYRFMAYASKDAKDVTVTDPSSTDASQSTTEFREFRIPYAFSDAATSTSTPYVSELWVSNNQTTGQYKYGEPVKLTFAPLIAKVRFKFKYAEGQEGQAPKITDISFKDSRWQKDANGEFQWTGDNEAKTPIAGTIVISYPLSETNTEVSKKWENTERGPLELTIPYEEEEKNAIHQTSTYQKWYYMPPMNIANYKQGSYTITANVNGNPVSATVSSEYTQWKAGCQYTYTFKISETNTSISFAEVQVEQWVENGVLDNNGNGTKDW